MKPISGLHAYNAYYLIGYQHVDNPNSDFPLPPVQHMANCYFSFMSSR